MYNYEKTADENIDRSIDRYIYRIKGMKCTLCLTSDYFPRKEYKKGFFFNFHSTIHK